MEEGVHTPAAPLAEQVSPQSVAYTALQSRASGPRPSADDCELLPRWSVVRDPRLAGLDLGHVPSRAHLHPFEAFENVGVDPRLQHWSIAGKKVAHERGPSHNPSHEVTAAIVVRPVEHRS